MASVFSDTIEDLLSPIKGHLDDDQVSEIMINHYKEIFIEKKGLLTLTSSKFPDEESLFASMRAIAQFVGKDFSEMEPILDARLPNGYRIHAILQTVAKKGLTVTIRKTKKERLSLKDLVASNSLTDITARFLDCCLFLSKNILISGGTGSGKTSVLNVLASRIPQGERIVTIEDASELMITHNHIVMLEERKKEPKISMNDLVRSAMRLRPDRIIIGEMRGAEALSFLQVLNTGHDGSMGTIHSNNALQACLRLESLCLMNSSAIPPSVLRQMIASSLSIIIQCSRAKNGHRRIVEISEVVGLNTQGEYNVKQIFKWHQESKDKGSLKPTRELPSFFDDIEAYGLPFKKDYLQ